MSLLDFLPLYLSESGDLTQENKIKIIQLHVKNLAEFIKKYQSLVYYPHPNHVTHFFSANDYETRLSKEWRNDLDSMSLAELIRMVTDDNYLWGQNMNIEENLAEEVEESNFETKWCSSLREYVLGCRKYKSRLANSNGKWITHELNENIDQLIKRSKSDLELYKGMSPKKVLEVTLLSNFIGNIASDLNISSAIDIGSGRGYLSHVLAVEHGLEVVGIDSNNHVAQKANEKVMTYDKIVAKRTQSTLKDLESISTNEIQSQIQLNKELINNNESITNVNHEVYKVNNQKLKSKKGQLRSLCSHIESNMKCADFLKIIGDQRLLQEKSMLIGLHTCGNLAPTTLRLFVNSEASALINVGCCYHKLYEKSDSDFSQTDREKIGFPLSKVLRDLELDLTTGARDLGCLATTKWNWKNLDKAINIFKRQSFRWVLDDVLVKNNCKPLGGLNTLFTVGSIPIKDWNSFSTYAYTSIMKMIKTNKIDAPESFLKYIEEDKEKFLSELESYYASFKPNEEEYIHSVAVWWCIRGLLGGIIEDLVLLDRILFLEESGCKAELYRLFPPDVSPRGYAIVGIKQ